MKFMLNILFFLLASSLTAACFAITPSACNNILSFGGDDSGETDNLLAFNKAVSASISPSSICVYFPAGTYKFNESPNISLISSSQVSSLTIVGDGQDVSSLSFASGVNGLNIQLGTQYQSFHIRDLSLLAGDQSTTTIGLSATQSQATVTNPANSAINDVTNVNIRGGDGYNVLNRWGYGVFLTGISNTNFSSVGITGSSQGGPYAQNGIGIKAIGTQSNPSVVVNLIASTINYCGIAFAYGNYLQGVSISQSNFVGNGTAIYQGPNQSGNDQLSITTSQFNNIQNIDFLSWVDGVSIVGNIFYGGGASATHINMQNANQFVIEGNAFNPLNSGQNGIVVGPTAANGSGIITGNSFKIGGIPSSSGGSATPVGFATAIWLQKGSSSVNVQSNIYKGTTNNVINNGTGNVIGGGSL